MAEKTTNQGEMPDADAVGTVGSPECGDMVRMFLKYREENGQRIIDRASFQAFGCQTALAVASMATKMLQGKTLEEARHMPAHELNGDQGPLPPMKIHCGQLVEKALHQALDGETSPPPATDTNHQPSQTLLNDLNQGPANPNSTGTLRVVLENQNQETP